MALTVCRNALEIRAPIDRGAFSRPLTAPSRYPEYALVQNLLRDSVNLEDTGTWLLDIRSPKLFSLLLAKRFTVHKPTSTVPDIHAPGDAILVFSRRRIPLK